MAKGIEWESRIGRRLRLRDLHVLFAVVQSGTMSGAAGTLGVNGSIDDISMTAFVSPSNSTGSTTTFLGLTAPRLEVTRE